MKIVFHPDKLLACIYLFLRSVARPVKTHVQRTANLDRLCIDLCFEFMQGTLSQVRSKQLTHHISTKQFWMAIVEVFLLIAHRLPHSQGQWKPSVCNPQSNRTVTRCPNVMAVDVGLVVGVKMMISVFLTRRDTIRIEAVHWEGGSLNGCLLFQASTCIVKFMHIAYTTIYYDILMV